MSGHSLSLEDACKKGIDFQMEGRFDLAEDLFLRVLAVDPDNPHALYLYGNLTLQTGRWEIAAQYLGRAVERWPGLTVAHAGLGKTLRKLGRLPEACQAYSQAHRNDPGDRESLEQLVEIKRLICDWEGLESIDAAFLDAIAQGHAADPFKALLVADNPAAQLASARNAANAIRQLAGNPPPRKRRPIAQHGPIRIGYLCADFHDHPLAVQYAQVPSRHDRARIHCTAYVQNPLKPGSAGQRMIDGCDCWRHALPLASQELADQIDEDGIDLLIDLSGFTTHRHKDVLLKVAAPVTVNYFGWPGSMGDLCDAIIADPVIMPPGSERHYHERVFRLATTYQPNDPERVIAPAPRRAEEGIPEDAFVFSSFVQPTKITPAIFDAWMTILKGVDHAVLWLWGFNPLMSENLQERARHQGVQPDRLIFAGGKPRPEHTARYGLVDLALDTPVYGGHSTTTDALWAGCPVLGLAGRGFPARVSASLLLAARLKDLVCTNLADYTAKAIHLARQPDELRAIRQRLSKDRKSLPLFDIEHFTKELDDTLLEIAESARRGDFA
ncbi:MAG: tetratricopeptide repeat protein [Alphaproteobacteria bacterium]|nr:tetratricopeptide repeat protein [Alphaproteobacteria bacterium]